MTDPGTVTGNSDSVKARYDTIGIDYARLRRPDPRIAAALEQALGPAESVLNVGAGAGSYEPADRQVTAVEPSIEMIRQRPADAAPAIQGHAEVLPFADKSFDAAMAILTVHHWSDKQQGLAEMRRVARDRVVLLTFDPMFRDIWLLDYFPEIAAIDEAQMPRIDEYQQWLGRAEVSALPIPHDCTDGFLYAYWRRPEAYLDPRLRKAMSTFWKIDDVEGGLHKLANDLESGDWARHYADLLACDEIDLGYRIIVAG